MITFEADKASFLAALEVNRNLDLRSTSVTKQALLFAPITVSASQ
ncbi:hypothetical protein D348_00126 [Enterococcus faecalis SLO2C-1]|nr:hypothetical protein D348_00126 [Enterococcus faecalis SLO2C-1]